MKTEMLINIWDLAMNVPKDLERTSPTPTVASQKLMTLLTTCLWLLLSLISNKVFSVAMVASAQPSTVSKALRKFKDHLKLNLVLTKMKITKRLLIYCGVILMNQKKLLVSNITISAILKNKTTLLTSVLIT